MDIVFKAPGKDEPGFLRRQRQAIEFSEKLTNKPTTKTIDAMVDFLLVYVVEPTDRKDAREALLDASEAQFGELLGVLAGGAENPTKATSS